MKLKVFILYIGTIAEDLMVDINQMNTHNIPYGAVKDVVPQGVSNALPQGVQNLSATEVKDTFESTNAGATVTSKEFTPGVLAGTGGVYAGFLLLRHFFDQSLNKTWDKSVLGKLSNFGDKVSDLTPDFMKKGASDASSGIKTFYKNNSDKFSLTRALRTPLNPENGMVKMQRNGLMGQVLSDTRGLLENYVGAQGSQTPVLKDMFKNVDAFKHLSDDKAILEEIGNIINSPKIDKDFVKQLIDTFEHPDNAQKIAVAGGKLKGPLKMFKYDVPFQQFANKLKGISGNGAKSALGKFMGLFTSGAFEGITNSFAGGKIMPIVSAFFVASAFKKAMEAPKGKKVGTFADNESRDVAMIFTMPLQAVLLYKAGGALKYLGMGKDALGQEKNVTAYRDAVKTFNDKVVTHGAFANKKEYKTALKEVKNALKADSKWYHKPFKAIGKFLSSGLEAETVKPFLRNSDKGLAKFADGFANFRYKFNTGFKVPFIGAKAPGVGGIMRFAIALFAISPIVYWPIQKLVEGIFGKAHDPEKDKAEAEKKTKKAEEEKKLAEQQKLVEKLEKNPQLIQRIQNDPKLMAEIQENPAKLVELINALDDPAQQQAASVPGGQNAQNSELLNKFVQKQGIAPNPATGMSNGTLNNMATAGVAGTLNNNGFYTSPNMPQVPQGTQQGMNFKQPEPNVKGTTSDTNSAPEVTPEPVRSYVPSDAPAPQAAQSSAAPSGLEEIFAKADKAEANAMKFL